MFKKVKQHWFFGVITGISLWLTVLNGFASATFIPDHPYAYVNDYANMLSSSTQQQLNQTLKAFEKKTSDQVVVATFNHLNQHSLDEFSIHLAEKWKVGSRQYNNGVILLIIKNDHKIRIEVGRGLEGALPDITASRIIRHAIAPAFKQGHYNQGVQQGVAAILQHIEPEYHNTNHFSLIMPLLKSFISNPMVVYLLLFFGLRTVVTYTNQVTRKQGNSYGYSDSDNSSSGFFSNFLGNSFDSSSDSFDGGGGDFDGGGADSDW